MLPIVFKHVVENINLIDWTEDNRELLEKVKKHVKIQLLIWSQHSTCS